MNDYPAKSAVGITIKSGKGFEDTWIMFNGSAAEIRKNLCEVFGLDAELDVTIAELSLLGQAAYQGITSVQQILGGEPIADPGNAKPKPGNPWGTGTPDPHDPPAEPSEADKVKAVLARIEAATTRTQVKDACVPPRSSS